MKPICQNCGTQYDEAPCPPTGCPVCQDIRQFVSPHGQAWTTHEELSSQFDLRLEDDAGVLGIGLSPDFGINQRALLLQTKQLNILWECVSLVTERAVQTLREMGGVDLIVISHPHFYASMVEWSDALGGVPILLHHRDVSWVRRPSPKIQFWTGDELSLSRSITLVRCGGHFPGSTAIHWKDGPRAGGALFPGDALQVVHDRRHVTFMYSYPNYMPLTPSRVREMRARLKPYAFEDAYGFTWGRNILGGAREAVDRSFSRYLAAIADHSSERPHNSQRPPNPNQAHSL